MSSAWGKFLAPVTVPTGGWTIRINYAGTGEVDQTIAAGTYSTMLHVCKAIADELDEGGTLTVSSSGIVTIDEADMSNIVWASSSAALIAALGFDQTETVDPVTSKITANNPHTYGWYPGTITYGLTRGEGISTDTTWIPEDYSSSVIAGNRSFTSIGPDAPPYRRELTFSMIKSTELVHASRGAKRLADLHRHKKLYWYPDRDDGVVGTYGTQGDPADYDSDDSLDAAGSYYWLVSQTKNPEFMRAPQHPDYFSVRLFLNAEPN